MPSYLIVATIVAGACGFALAWLIQGSKLAGMHNDGNEVNIVQRLKPKTLIARMKMRIARKRDTVFLTREFRDLGGEDQVLRALARGVDPKSLRTVELSMLSVRPSHLDTTTSSGFASA